MKKSFKGKYFRAVTCLGLGIIILCVAVFANYDNANGYTEYKNALKQIPFEENVSMDGSLIMSFDGEQLEHAELKCQYDKDGTITRAIEEKNYNAGFGEEIYTSRACIVDGLTYRETFSEDSDGSSYRNINGSGGGYDDTGLLGFGEDDQPVVEKIIRVAELTADAFIGDIKNNFVLTENDGGNKRYTVTLTETQIPEIVNAGISMFASMLKVNTADVDVSGDYPGADLDRMMTEIMCSDREPYVSKATCDLTLNEQGKLTANILSATLTGFDASGESHDLTLTVELELYDYGTTEIQLPEFMANPPMVTLLDGTVVSAFDLFSDGYRVNGNMDENTTIYLHNYSGGQARDEIVLNNGIQVSR